MNVAETVNTLGAAAVGAGVAYQTGVASGGDLSWFMDPRSALIVLAGLTGGFGFRLSVIVHKRGEVSLWREVLAGGLALPANFLLAAGLTSTLLSHDPPAYPLIALFAVMIGASGTTALTLAAKQWVSGLPGMLRTIIDLVLPPRPPTA